LVFHLAHKEGVHNIYKNTVEKMKIGD
jgi:hypothetical protein